MVDFSHALQSFSSEATEWRGRPVRWAKAAGPSSDLLGRDFPPGTTDCDCTRCVEGADIVDADPGTSPCCKSALVWKIICPLTLVERKLYYAGLDKWVSDPFEGTWQTCDPLNFYQWVMSPSVTAGASTLILVTATDNGCDETCVVFKAPRPFNCKCNMQFDLDDWKNISLAVLQWCRVCAKPQALVDMTGVGDDHCAACAAIGWEVEFSGVTTDDDLERGGIQAKNECSEECADWFNDTHLLLPYNAVFETENGPKCQWYQLVPDAISNVDPAFGEFREDYCGGQQSDCAYGLRIDFSSGGNPTLTVITFCKCNKHPNQSGPGTGPGGYITYTTNVGSLDCAEPITLQLREPFVDFDPDEHCYTCLGFPAEVTITPLGTLPTPTDSGRCQSPSCGGAAPTNDTGACCALGRCWDFWDEVLCDLFLGLWHDTLEECVEGCGTAFCCTPDGDSVEMGYEACLLIGGTPAFSSGACEGACCGPDGGCTQQTEINCSDPGYTFYGLGTSCSGKNCRGACCCNGPETCCFGDNMTYDECFGADGFGPIGDPYDCSEQVTFLIDEFCAACEGAGGC
jgi:hypothetical protein